jgi:hypothetical protein
VQQRRDDDSEDDEEEKEGKALLTADIQVRPRKEDFGHRGGRGQRDERKKRPKVEDYGKRDGNYEQFYKNDKRFIQHCILSEETDRFKFSIIAYQDDLKQPALTPEFI